MADRWRILAVLFAARVAMGFQFQAAAALSASTMETFGVGLADLGLLIGLYLSPGIVIALPGGAIGARFGDRQVVIAGMVLMTVGGLIMTLSPDWTMQLAGRLIAGAGGVTLNVLMSKMVTDWFAGREIATAMGVFVNSWPVGIALALMTLPPVADWAGLTAAMTVVVVLVIAGLLLFATVYRAPSAASAPAPLARQTPARGTLAAIVGAGAVWGLYNAALGMIFGFGPAMLLERGWSPTGAASTTSIVMWLVAVSVPLGGWLADWTGRRDAILAGSMLAFAALLALATREGGALLMFAALGLIGGLPAGPIMSLPAGILAPHERALGMGLFFTLFYLAIFVAPVVAGWLSEASGSAEAAFLFGAVLLIAASAIFTLLRITERPAPAG